MKLHLLTVAAIAATSLFAACGSKDKTTEPLPLTVIEDEPSDALYEPVTADTDADTTFVYGDKSVNMRLIDRIYRVSDDRYLSVSLMVPADRSALTTSMMALVDSNFYYYTDMRLPQHGTIDTPAAMTSALPTYGPEFTRVIIPEATADGGDGGFNVTIAARPVYTDGRLMTYQIFTSAYTGGAHPDSNYYYATYDSHSGLDMSFDALVPFDQRARVRQQLVANLAEHYNLTITEYLKQVNDYVMPDATLYPDGYTAETLPVSATARIAQGYVFSFAQGEIAPYSDGNIIITVDDAPAAE